MAWYAQRNYPQKIGSCNLTIAQVGCFLTSFSNLEKRFGRAIDPPTLNSKFKALGAYIGGCNLYWNAIRKYDNYTNLVATGTGVPPSSNAIVEFVYGGGNTHFCMVKSRADHTIVDSWDGQIRNWSYYGGPKSWATYKDTKPVSTAAYYKIVSGDTLSAIATRYHTTVAQLVSWNKAHYPSLASNPNSIQIGWVLRVH